MKKMIILLTAFFNLHAYADKEVTIELNHPESVQTLIKQGKDTNEHYTAGIAGNVVQYTKFQVNSYTECYLADKVVERSFFFNWNFSLKTASYCLIKIIPGL